MDQKLLTNVTKFARLSAPLSIIFGLVLIVYGFRDELFTTELSKENSPYVLMGGLYTLVGVFVFLFKYIETGPAFSKILSPKSYSNLDDFEEKIERQLRKLKIELSNVQLKGDGNKIDQATISELIQEKIDLNVEDSLKKLLETNYSNNALKIKHNRMLDNQTLELQIGVNNQIGKLSRSGTINLIIGLITTLTAIWILASLVLSVKDIHFDTTKDFYIYLTPRLSLAIFIEVFSFFFLRLYKRNLEDVKYFHNERTNIDSKIIALKAALLLEKEELLNEIIKSFANVERNFILKKDETTVNLERVKIETQQEMDYISKISEIVQKVR